MATNNEKPAGSGLTEAEAKEVNGWFVRGFLVYVSFAIVAHILMWMWRPWINVG